jgi:hypothetical protein
VIETETVASGVLGGGGDENGGGTAGTQAASGALPFTGIPDGVLYGIIALGAAMVCAGLFFRRDLFFKRES